MFGIQTLLRLGATGTAAPTTGWAGRSLGSKMLGSTIEPITSRIMATPIISKIGLGAKPPETYRSLQQDAESYKFYKQGIMGSVTTASALKAVTTTSILEKVVYGAIAAFGTGMFFKTSRDDSTTITKYKTMQQLTSKQVYIAESTVVEKESNGQGAKYQYHYVTLADQEGKDVLVQNQPMIGKNPKFVTRSLTAEIIVQQQKNGVIFETGQYQIHEEYVEAVYEPRGDTNFYTSDLCKSLNMPIALTTSARVREVLNSQLLLQDVEDALNFRDISHVLETKQENYENSSSYFTKFINFLGMKGNKDNIAEQWNKRANDLEKINAIARELSEKEDDISEDNSSIFVKTEDNNPEYCPGEAAIYNSIYYDADNNPEVTAIGDSMWEAAVADAG